MPPEREDRVLDHTRVRLKKIVSQNEESIRKLLTESSSTPAIDQAKGLEKSFKRKQVALKFKQDFGSVASVVEEEIKVT